MGSILVEEQSKHVIKQKRTRIILNVFYGPSIFSLCDFLLPKIITMNFLYHQIEIISQKVRLAKHSALKIFPLKFQIFDKENPHPLYIL